MSKKHRKCNIGFELCPKKDKILTLDINQTVY